MLKEIKNGKKAAFIPFLVVGDPNLEVSEKVFDVLVSEGADLVELGVPFTDAMADGPVIQAASERAAHSTSLLQVLHFAKKMKQKHSSTRLMIFTYLNPVFKMGFQKFANTARDCGVDAVLMVDLPPEEASEYKKIMAENGLKMVFLASPTSTKERLQLAADSSTGFIYYVSRTGVTGVQKDLSTTLASEIESLRKMTSKSIAIGFGISTAEQAKKIAHLGDAVVVGSAFVKIISDINDSNLRLEKVRALAKELVGALK